MELLVREANAANFPRVDGVWRQFIDSQKDTALQEALALFQARLADLAALDADSLKVAALSS